MVCLIFTLVCFRVTLSLQLFQFVGSIGALVQRQRPPAFHRTFAVATVQFTANPTFHNIATNTVAALAVPLARHRWSHLASGTQHRRAGAAACPAELVSVPRSWCLFRGAGVCSAGLVSVPRSWRLFRGAGVCPPRSWCLPPAEQVVPARVPWKLAPVCFEAPMGADFVPRKHVTFDPEESESRSES